MAGSPSDYEADILADCQEAIGYKFRKPELLRSALTHTSGANTRLASFERLEFLGDAVLGLVCVEQLYHRFPEYQEGDMTKVRVGGAGPGDSHGPSRDRARPDGLEVARID